MFFAFLFFKPLKNLLQRKTLKQSNHFVTLFYNDVYEVVLPPGHRFPMNKYSAVRKLVQAEFLQNPFVSFEVSPLATRTELESTHCPSYIDRFLSGRLSFGHLLVWLSHVFD